MKLPDAARRAQILDKATAWVLAIAIMLGVVGLSWGVYEAGQARSLTQQIRTTQIESAKKITDINKKLSAVSACQNVAFNAILYDTRLAFSGDRNPADYLKAPDKC